MPAPPKSIAHARARKAGLIKNGHDHDDPRVVQADQDLATANLAAYIERVVAASPPLTEAQVDRLTAAFRQTSGSDAA